MFIDILIALVIVLILVVGGGELTMENVIVGLVIAGVLMVVLHFIVHGIINWIASQLTGSGGLWYRLASRRRMYKSPVARNRQEVELDGMDEKELRAWIEKHPQDALACEVLCERLKKRGEWAEYARELFYLLNLETDMRIDEICSRYHELADIYINRLGHPERAAEPLSALIARFPQHYQATLARRRLEDLRATANRE